MYVLTLILVVFSAERVDTIYGGCVSLSLLVHYFTLAAVMWMGAEALLMFQKLVIVFIRVTTKFIIIISVICWSKLSLINLVVVAKYSNCFLCTLQLYQLCLYLFLSLWIWQMVVMMRVTSSYNELKWRMTYHSKWLK